MTWNPNRNIALNESVVKLYDSPYSVRDSKAATNSSKINQGFAFQNYSAREAALRMAPQACPIVDKSQSLRYQIEPSKLTNFMPSAEMSVVDTYKEELKDIKERYEAKINVNNSKDFRKEMQLSAKLEDNVLKNMYQNAPTTIQHKVFGTDLPMWYISNIIFLTLLEQEYANTYAPETTTKSFLTPSSVCDMIYELYIKENFDKEKVKSEYIKFLENPDQNISNLASSVKAIEINKLTENDDLFYPVLAMASAFQYEGDKANAFLAAIGSTKKVMTVQPPECINFKLNLPAYKKVAEKAEIYDGQLKQFCKKMVEPVKEFESWLMVKKSLGDDVKKVNNFDVIENIEEFDGMMDEPVFKIAKDVVNEENQELAEKAVAQLYQSGGAINNPFILFYYLMNYVISYGTEKGWNKENFDETVELVKLESEKGDNKFVVADEKPLPNPDFVHASVFERIIHLDNDVIREVSRRIYGEENKAQTPISEPIEKNAVMVEAFPSDDYIEQKWKDGRKEINSRMNDPKSWVPSVSPVRLSSTNDHKERFTDHVHKAGEITAIVCICIMVVVFFLLMTFLVWIPKIKSRKMGRPETTI